MRRAPLAVGLAVIVGCASILDIPRLEPPAGGVDGGIDSSDGGSCQAEGVTNLTVAPRSVLVALDETDAYFTRSAAPPQSAILRCSKCGCKEPTTVVGGLANAAAIAVDDRYVFWTEGELGGSLNRVDKSDPTKRKQITGWVSPYGVTVDADFVYWTVIGGDDLSSAGVYRATKDLGAVTRLAKTADSPDNIIPYGIAVDDTYVYYTLASNLNEGNSALPCDGESGTVRRVRKDGGLQVSTTIAKGQACPIAIALSELEVYWVNLGAGTEASSGSLWTAPKAGGPAKRLADKIGRPTSLALHAGRLTWTAPGFRRIDSCRAPDCSGLATLADDPTNPSGVSADGSGIYWVTLGRDAQLFQDGAERRAPAPP